MLDDIIASGECYSISQLAIKENDLITPLPCHKQGTGESCYRTLLYEAVLGRAVAERCSDTA